MLNGGGEHVLLLTHAQIARIERTKMIGKSKANVQHQGCFLYMLADLAAKALPTILGGLATGLVSGAVDKAVGGNGLYLQKSRYCVKVEPVIGNVLYLTPHARLPGVHGDGLYLTWNIDL